MVYNLQKLLLLLLWASSEASRPSPLGFYLKTRVLDGLRKSAFSILPYVTLQKAASGHMGDPSVDMSLLREYVNAGMIYVKDSYIQPDEVAALRERREAREHVGGGELMRHEDPSKRDRSLQERVSKEEYHDTWSSC